MKIKEIIDKIERMIPDIHFTFNLSALYPKGQTV